MSEVQQQIDAFVAKARLKPGEKVLLVTGNLQLVHAILAASTSIITYAVGAYGNTPSGAALLTRAYYHTPLQEIQELQSKRFLIKEDIFSDIFDKIILDDVSFADFEKTSPLLREGGLIFIQTSNFHPYLSQKKYEWRDIETLSYGTHAVLSNSQGPQTRGHCELALTSYDWYFF